MNPQPWLLSYFTQSVRLNPDVLLIKGRVLKIDIILPLSVRNYRVAQKNVHAFDLV
jgi:hypothetical protein